MISFPTSILTNGSPQDQPTSFSEVEKDDNFASDIIVVVWEMVWKGIALWKAGRNSQIGWFVAIFILNTLGILPIIYIFGFSKKGN